MVKLFSFFLYLLGRHHLMRYVLLLFYCSLCSGDKVNAQELNRMVWDELPPIPSQLGDTYGEGLAGHFAGVHIDALLVAGGSYFNSKGRPWNGDKRNLSDAIHVLEYRSGGKYQWLDSVFRLPTARAYGASVSTPEGVICIGGADSSSYHDDVIQLSWSKADRVVSIRNLPDLPAPMAYMGAVLLDNAIYVAGGEASHAKGHATKAFYRLDLGEDGNSDWQWESLPPWDGPGRVMPVLAAQNNGRYPSLFLFSGRGGAVEGEELLYDAHVYDTRTNQWKQLQNIRLGDDSMRCLSGASSVAVGLNHVLVFSGADSEDHRQFRSAQNAYRNSVNAAERDSLRRELNEIVDNHDGFSGEVLAYHTLTDSWITIGEFPRAAPVATQAVWWHNEIVIPGGEVAPALRSP